MTQKNDGRDRSLMSSGIHSRPRDVTNGIKPKGRAKGKLGETWWADRWIGVLNGFGWGSRLERGKTYARRGQTLNLDVQPGRVSAKVQGSRIQPYDVTVAIPQLSAKTWEKVFDSLAQKAVFAAKLLAGDMPQDIEEAFYAAGTWLFPKTEHEIVSQCSCPDPVRPCKHLAAVHYMLADAFDEDPFLLFTLRGKTKDEIAKALRERRAQSAPDQVSGGATTGPGGSGPAKPIEEPVELVPERFFDLRAELAHASVALDPPQPAVHALGPLKIEKEDALPEIEKVVARLRDAALAIAFKGTEEDEDAEPKAKSAV